MRSLEASQYLIRAIDALDRDVVIITPGFHTEDIPPYEFSPSDDKFLMARCQPVRGANGQCLGTLVLSDMIDQVTESDQHLSVGPRRRPRG